MLDIGLVIKDKDETTKENIKSMSRGLLSNLKVQKVILEGLFVRMRDDENIKVFQGMA